MVGLRTHHWPAADEKKELHGYIFLKYGRKTLSELVLAFDLAINGELELKPEDVKVYDQFTISYLATIMAAYKVWLRKQTDNVKPTPSKQFDYKKHLTDEEKQQWVDEWKQKEDIDLQLVPVLFYDFLLEQSEISPDNKTKNEYLGKAVNNIRNQLQAETTVGGNDAYLALNTFTNMERDGFTGQMKERIINLSKKMIVFDYLKTEH